MLHLHRAERCDRLVEALGDVLREPLPDPFCAEVISVPAKGVERWLSQQLSTRPRMGRYAETATDGVSANILFLTPDRLISQAIQAAQGRHVDDSPWAPNRLRWATLAVIDECVAEPWCSVLAAHLGSAGSNGQADHRRGRRWATAARLADRFVAYGCERPQILIDWAAGSDTDGTGAALPEHLQWQAEVWRRLRLRIGVPSPAERLSEICDRLRASPDIVDLPDRISFFGPTRLTAEQRAVLAALAAHREVHLWLPHPSPVMWNQLRDSATVQHRDQDLTGLAVTNPLLAALGRDTRELQQRLQPLVAAGTDTYHPARTEPAAQPVRTTRNQPARTVRTNQTEQTEQNYPAVDRPATLLQTLQAAVRDDQLPAHTAAADQSIQVHACHGPARQVEVLREALLHAFENDPTLEPRDVLVMCPEVETYAALIRASFGQGSAAGPQGHPGHRLRVRLADRSLHQTNPLLTTVSTLLALADDRVSAGQVLDLAASAGVRRQFGFDDDDLEQIRTWARQTGVRWGIGPRQRRDFGLERIEQGTWSTGLDRLLLGVAADETEPVWLQRALPLDDVDSTDIHLAGRLAELIDRLWSVLFGLTGEHTGPEWAARLERGLDLLTAVRERDAWQLSQARRELAEAVAHAGEQQLGLADVRAMLADRLAARPTRANFRTGDLTVATMVPMRSVPHRVIALLGLDDEVFPRATGVDGDDVLSARPGIGERDRRSEDRHLLLDAVMSAGETLIVLYTGADPVSGVTRPPAVPLGELLDTIALTCGQDIVRRHPLQPFAPRNVDAAAPFSFDTAALAGARAALGPQRPIAAMITRPLPVRAADAGTVDLADLIAFCEHPVRAFLRQRLEVRLPAAPAGVSDQLEAGLDGLAKWEIGERMLAARLQGMTAADFAAAERRRGTLPPLRLGAQVLAELEARIEALVRVCLPMQAGPGETVDLDLDLGTGRRLSGTITGVYARARTGVQPGARTGAEPGAETGVLATCTSSTLAGRHRIAAWVRLLALAAGRPDTRWQAVTTGRGQFSRPTQRATATLPADPLSTLRDLVELRAAGLLEPLPMAPGASAVYADRRSTGSSVPEATEAAAREWSSTYGDHTDRHLSFLYGPSPRFESQLAPSQDTERDWYPEPTRFGVFARRLWAPLLAHEQVGQP